MNFADSFSPLFAKTACYLFAQYEYANNRIDYMRNLSPRAWAAIGLLGLAGMSH